MTLRLLKYLPLLFIGMLQAQEEIIHSVYFEFDKFSLKSEQLQGVVAFIRAKDSTRIETIEIFGYCDDRGKDAYNFKLSQNRANAIQEEFLKNGITNKVIITIEGKGRIMIDDDVEENIPEIRSKNRRVDVVLNLKPLPKIQLPGFYNEIQKKHVVGDHIYLDDLLFDRGSSVLTSKSKFDLAKLARMLLRNKHIEFEIQGHICCTPRYQKEAIDRHTGKRKLSHNRAEAVYKYLILKKIPKNRMTFKGYGNTVPLGKGTEYDRRVELLITKI
jgi:outer membrane protein OmpA-like peptidoglycan-associated protein